MRWVKWLPEWKTLQQTIFIHETSKTSHTAPLLVFVAAFTQCPIVCCTKRPKQQFIRLNLFVSNLCLIFAFVFEYYFYWWFFEWKMPELDILTVRINGRQIFLSWFYLHFKFIFHVLFNCISFVLICDFVFCLLNIESSMLCFNFRLANKMNGHWMLFKCLIVRWNMLSSFASNFPTTIIKCVKISSYWLDPYPTPYPVFRCFVSFCEQMFFFLGWEIFFVEITLLWKIVQM